MPPLDAVDQAELVRSGEASPLELLDAAIERIERLNPELNAVIHPMFDGARAEAQGELPDGPFKGVPMLVKDLLCHTAGDPMHEGMGFLKGQNWIEEEDQELARRFRSAGFLIAGKTNTPELGILPTTEPLAYGATLNPWNTGYSTGGSSGGSAAAVASGMVAVAHANDGGGSIRIPAANCGLVGLKPTRGRNPLGPDFGDLFSGLVHEHVVTRTVRDSAAVLDAVHGPALGEPYFAPPPERPFAQEVGADPGTLRIALWTKPPGGEVEVHQDNLDAVEGAARALEGLGHTVEPIELAALQEPQTVFDFLVRWTTGVAWNLDYWGRKTGREITEADVEPATWALAEQGRAHSAAAYLTAIENQQALTRKVAEEGERFDIVLSPTTAVPPTPIGAFDVGEDGPLVPILTATPVAAFCTAYNISGQPAISLPLRWNADGLPIGVMAAAKAGREDLLIRLASQLEEAEPWAERVPPLFADAPALD